MTKNMKKGKKLPNIIPYPEDNAILFLVTMNSIKPLEMLLIKFFLIYLQGKTLPLILHISLHLNTYTFTHEHTFINSYIHTHDEVMMIIGAQNSSAQKTALRIWWCSEFQRSKFWCSEFLRSNCGAQNSGTQKYRETD